MKFTASIASLFVFVASALAESASVSFDNVYDNSGGSMKTVSCSSGPNGLASRFPTFGDLPSFPNIGGGQVVSGFGSPECGSCWMLFFEGNTINGESCFYCGSTMISYSISFPVTVIDHASNGFNIAETAMNTLTNGQAESLGRIHSGATNVPQSSCGL